MVYSAISDSVGAINQFTRYENVTLSHSGALSAYQKKLTIPYDAAMQTNFNDTRFNIWNGTVWEYVPHWLESKTDSSTADVWIKNDYVDGDTVVRMYYGNDGLSSGSSIDDTFIFGDDCTGTLTDKWDNVDGDNIGDFSYSSGYMQASFGADGNRRMRIKDSYTLPNDVIIESKVYLSGTNGIAGIMPRYIDKNNNYDMWVASPDIAQAKMFKTISGSRTEVSNTTSVSISEDTWHDIKVTAIGSNFEIFADGISKHSASDASHATGRVGLYAYYSAGTQRWDNIRVRKYTATEPTYTIGTPQHQRRVPAFVN